MSDTYSEYVKREIKVKVHSERLLKTTAYGRHIEAEEIFRGLTGRLVKITIETIDGGL